MKSSRCVARRERRQASITPLRRINLSPPNICYTCLRLLSTATQRRVVKKLGGRGSRLHGGKKRKNKFGGFFMRRGTIETSLRGCSLTATPRKTRAAGRPSWFDRRTLEKGGASSARRRRRRLSIRGLHTSRWILHLRISRIFFHLG